MAHILREVAQMLGRSAQHRIWHHTHSFLQPLHHIRVTPVRGLHATHGKPLGHHWWHNNRQPGWHLHVRQRLMAQQMMQRGNQGQRGYHSDGHHGTGVGHFATFGLSAAALAAMGIIYHGSEAHAAEGLHTPMGSRRPSIVEQIAADEAADADRRHRQLLLSQIAIGEKVHGLHRHGVEEVHTNQYAANPLIEDTFKAEPTLINGPGGLFGVFDGHTGRAASAFCRDELFGFIERHWQATRMPVLTAEPFVAADNEFLQRAIKAKEEFLAGACMVVAHVTSESVTTANAGDCRAVIGRRITNSNGTYEWQAIPLTTDHQIKTNPAEEARLIAEHPHETDVVVRGRVKGRLEPTRGIGDGMYKRREFFDRALTVKPELAKYTTWAPPYTTAVPEISHHRLDKNDMFLILSSDGLFSDLSSQDAVNLVGSYMQRHRSRSPATASRAGADVSASTYLIEAALAEAGHRYQRYQAKHNQTIPSSSPLDSLDAVMRLPQSMKRRMHDDITCLVVFLNPTGAPPAAITAA